MFYKRSRAGYKLGGHNFHREIRHDIDLAVRSRGVGGGGTGEPGKLWYVSSQKVVAVVSRADGSGTSGADAIQVAVAGYSANR